MSPCGRIVDYLRECYASRMRFFRDDPQRVTDVEWYWVPADRDVIPYSHLFGSQVWAEDDEPQPELGELYAPVSWRGGQPPCPETTRGLCGSEQQWSEGISVTDPQPETWPGTNIGKCCALPLVGSCGGIAIGRAGFGRCHMESTFDVHRPFGAGAPLSVNNACQFVEDLLAGRGTSPNNTVAWTHYIDFAQAIDCIDGVTRTPAVNTLNYFDGDEVRIPTGGSTQYVVVWVTLCDVEGTIVKRAYLMRHLA